MKKYDYYLEVTNDIENWMEWNEFDLSQFEDREEAAEYLNDILWTEDEITGNGSQFYANEEECEEYLCHNISLIIEACENFAVNYLELHKYYVQETLARCLDCTIRCYILPEAIEKALITWEGYGFKYKNI